MDTLLRDPSPGVPRFRAYREQIAAIERESDTRRGVKYSCKGGWFGISDTGTQFLDVELGGEEVCMTLDAHMLSGDNGFPTGVQMRNGLRLNKNLGGEVRGPVVLTVCCSPECLDGYFTEGFDVAMNMPSVEAIMVEEGAKEELVQLVRACVHQRYMDAGILPYE